VSAEELQRLSRDELDERAAQLGVPDPAGLPNKAAVVAAIESIQGAGPAAGPRSLTARRARMLRMRRARGQL
jgi:hypothetical protein